MTRDTTQLPQVTQIRLDTLIRALLIGGPIVGIAGILLLIAAAPPDYSSPPRLPLWVHQVGLIFLVGGLGSLLVSMILHVIEVVFYGQGDEHV